MKTLLATSVTLSNKHFKSARVVFRSDVDVDLKQYTPRDWTNLFSVGKQADSIDDWDLIHSQLSHIRQHQTFKWTQLYTHYRIDVCLDLKPCINADTLTINEFKNGVRCVADGIHKKLHDNHIDEPISRHYQYKADRWSASIDELVIYSNHCLEMHSLVELYNAMLGKPLTTPLSSNIPSSFQAVVTLEEGKTIYHVNIDNLYGKAAYKLCFNGVPDVSDEVLSSAVMWLVRTHFDYTENNKIAMPLYSGHYEFLVALPLEKEPKMEESNVSEVIELYPTNVSASDTIRTHERELLQQTHLQQVADFINGLLRGSKINVHWVRSDSNKLQLMVDSLVSGPIRYLDVSHLFNINKWRLTHSEILRLLQIIEPMTDQRLPDTNMEEL